MQLSTDGPCGAKAVAEYLARIATTKRTGLSRRKYANLAEARAARRQQDRERKAAKS